MQRLSIDFNSFAGIKLYQLHRLMIMGGHVETLFLVNGFQDFSIPDCNFIHFAIVDNRNDNIHLSGTQLSIAANFDETHFFSLDASGQVRYIVDIVYESLEKVFKFKNLDLAFLESVFHKMNSKDFFVLHHSDNDINRGDKSGRITLKSKFLYDCYSYKIDYVAGSVIKTFDICSIKPLYLPSEHGGYPKFNDTVEIVVGPNVSGWIDEDKFEMSCAHKKYLFSKASETLTTTEDLDIRKQFVNWESVN